MALRPRTPGARALLPATRSRSSGPLGALLSSPAPHVRLITALQVLQVLTANLKALSLRTRTPGARALLPVTRHRSSGPLGALLSSPALDVRLMTALQVLQVLQARGRSELKGAVFEGESEESAIGSPRTPTSSKNFSLQDIVLFKVLYNLGWLLKISPKRRLLPAQWGFWRTQ